MFSCQSDFAFSSKTAHTATTTTTITKTAQQQQEQQKPSTTAQPHDGSNEDVDDCDETKQVEDGASGDDLLRTLNRKQCPPSLFRCTCS